MTSAADISLANVTNRFVVLPMLLKSNDENIIEKHPPEELQNGTEIIEVEMLISQCVKQHDMLTNAPTSVQSPDSKTVTLQGFHHFNCPCKDPFVLITPFFITVKNYKKTNTLLKPVTTHTVRQLAAAQLCAADAIPGLEHNSPTPLRTQADHCGLR